MRYALEIKPSGLLAVIIAFFSFRAEATTYYVDINSTNPTPPYTNWSTASTDIQSAVNETTNGDLLLVNPGVYQSGGYKAPDGSLTSVVVTNAVTLLGADGANTTLINGSNTMRCIYLGNGAILNNFTLTNGNAGSGAGVYCVSTRAEVMNSTIVNNSADGNAGAYSGTLTNCTIQGNVTGNPYGSGATDGAGAGGSVLYNCTVSGNSAYGAGACGGGAYYSVLNNCTVANNHADFDGGGLFNCVITNGIISNNNSDYGGGGAAGGSTAENECTLVNCVLTGNDGTGYGGAALYATLINCTVCYYNYAQYGGGANSCRLYNSIIYYNDGSDSSGCTLDNCCSPGATGAGNITNAPLFFFDAFQLQNNSPCINAGSNAFVVTAYDLGGNPRIVGGTVDMGAYENQSATTASGLPAIPSSLSGAYQDGSVGLNWPSCSKASSYNVYRATAYGGPYTNTAEVTATHYSDASIVNGGTYFYYVTAVNAYGESAGSPLATVYIVDHFAIAPIASPQTSSVPFTVTITACDSGGNVLNNFTGAGTLGAVGDYGTDQLTIADTSAFINGQWTGTAAVVAAYPDTNMRLSCSSNGAAGLSNPFNVVPPAIQEFNVSVADMVYNPFNKLMYATVSASGANGGAYSNSLITVDPVFGRIINSYYLGYDPNQLDVSSDGHFLYLEFNGTNAFARFNIASNMIDMETPLSTTAAGIAAVPGLPNSVAVCANGIEIFDDGIQRSNTYPTGSFVVAGSANEFFTEGGGGTPFAILSVDASGITNYTYEDDAPVNYLLNTIKCQDGLIFVSDGTVFNPTNSYILGTLTNCYIVEPDLPAHTIDSMGYQTVAGSPDAWTIYAWNPTNFQLIGNLPIPDDYDIYGSPSAFIRWGTNGLAFNDVNSYIPHFVLVRSSLIPLVRPAIQNGSMQTPGTFQLNFTGDVADPYSIWTSTNCFNWTRLGAPDLMSNDWLWFSDSNASFYQLRFYRVSVP